MPETEFQVFTYKSHYLVYTSGLGARGKEAKWTSFSFRIQTRWGLSDRLGILKAICWMREKTGAWEKTTSEWRRRLAECTRLDDEPRRWEGAPAVGTVWGGPPRCCPSVQCTLGLTPSPSWKPRLWGMKGKNRVTRGPSWLCGNLGSG